MAIKKVLLINPSTAFQIYKKTKILIPYAPNITIATLASPLIKKGHNVELLDLAIESDLENALITKLKAFNPDYVGITFSTGGFPEMQFITKIIRKFNPDVMIIGGGPHASAMPSETLKESGLDIVVIGEGEYTLIDIVSGKNPKDIKGIAYKNKKKIVITPPRPAIEDLDSLPYPAWGLYDLSRYESHKSIVMRSPVGFIETSRGCPFGCTFCNKSIFGYKFRYKSPKRVVDEIEYLLDLGFKEIHPQDDAFTTDLNRAKEICDEIIRRKLKFPWIFGNGVRANRIDKDFLIKAKKAGCYSVYFGVESADSKILSNVHKNLSIDEVKQAIKWAKDVGLKTATFFMFGLPGETKESMEKTIKLAVSLDTSLTKVSILIPFPGTRIWDDWSKKGYIKSKDWGLYSYHGDPRKIYDHPDLEWDTINYYYKKFYRKFYLNPSFLIRRLKEAILEKHLMSDLKYFFSKYVFST